MDAFLDDGFDDAIGRGVVVGAREGQRFQQQRRRLWVQGVARALENVQRTQRVPRHAVQPRLRLNTHRVVKAHKGGEAGQA